MANPDPTAERQLASAIAAGDPEAARRLCEDYLPRLHGYILQRSGLDSESAAEAAQETILAALRSAQYFRGEAGLYTWLCAIARRKVADIYRRKVRRPLSLDDLVTDGLAVIDTEPLPEELIEREEVAATVHSALWSLPDDQRDAVLRKYIEESSVAEIALELGRSEKAVESLLSRGRANLRKRLVQFARGAQAGGGRANGRRVNDGAAHDDPGGMAR